MKSLIDQIDTDGDGRIDFDEVRFEIPFLLLVLDAIVSQFIQNGIYYSLSPFLKRRKKCRSSKRN